MPFTIDTFQYHPGGQLPLIFVVWKTPINPEDDPTFKTNELKCFASIIDKLPRYISRLRWHNFQSKYSDCIGSSLPSSLMNVMYRELSGDSSSSSKYGISKETEERIMRYVVSEGDPNLWPDLRAVMSGAKEKYAIFIK